MKNEHRWWSIMFVAVGVCAFSAWMLTRSDNEKPPAGKKQVNNRQLGEEKAQPEGPLTFWSGEVVIGEGPHRGKIELVAAPNKKAVVLTADEGVCRFDSIAGMKPGEMYIRLQERGHAPLISLALFEKGKETEMHPVYQLSRAVKEGKLTPLIAPHIMPPAERKYRQKGKELEGYTWSISSYDMQVYGHERKKDPSSRYGSTAIELTPSVKADLKPIEINLVERYFTEEELAKMAAADRKFDGYSEKNRLTEFKTAAGKFRVVSCRDRYSTDPNAKNSGGLRFATLQLPNGKWIRDLGMEEKVEVDGRLYLMCRNCIFKWISNEKLEVVVSFERIGTKWSPYIDYNEERRILGYLAVNKSSDGDFGGLLEYRDGERWVFHQYDGDYTGWLEAAGYDEKDRLILRLFNGWEHQKGRPAPRIHFDPTKGVFTDL